MLLAGAIAAGQVAFPLGSGTLTLIEADDTATATGALKITGVVSLTDSNDILIATSAPPITGALAVALAGDTLAGTGAKFAPILGLVTKIEAGDTLAATGADAARIGAVLREEGSYELREDNSRILREA